MRQHLRRTTSLLLVLALCFSLVLPGIPSAAAFDQWWLPYVEASEENIHAPGVTDGHVTTEGGYVLFTSDVHRYAYLARELLAAANGLAKADGAESNVGLFAFGGDFANEYVLYQDNMTIFSAVSKSFA